MAMSAPCDGSGFWIVMYSWKPDRVVPSPRSHCEPVPVIPARPVSPLAGRLSNAGPKSVSTSMKRDAVNGDKEESSGEARHSTILLNGDAVPRRLRARGPLLEVAA